MSRSWGRRLLSITVLATALVLLGCQKPAPGPIRGECPTCTWELLGVHRPAAAQPTSLGTALMTLCPWRGRLYVGYGDYQDNTGPIEILAWDPGRRGFTRVHVSDTEAIYNFRVIGNSLYAPATDRRESADYAVGEPWRDVEPVTTAHAFDMATLDGRDLWMVGSSDGNYLPTAWRSTDGGAHWTVAHQKPDPGRYYFAAVYHGRLYVESWALSGVGPSEVFDGASWRPGPELLPVAGFGFRPIVFADRLVYSSKQTIDSPQSVLRTIPNRLLGFDGTAVSIVFEREVLDFFAEEHQLLVLDTEGVIWRTTDLASWSRLTTASTLRPRSLAVLDGTLYVGTLDSRLYRLVGWP
ncbi:MAG TPA: hypothetical protein VFT22_36255 [Kofleriaceae bacterium]|nr:hypothetical protein [Kofleriaceae bacterium]